MEECAICLDCTKDELFMTTKCNHTFHEMCLALWIVHSSSCPICRKKCVKNDCIPSNKILYRERVVKYWFQLEEPEVIFEYWNDKRVTWQATWLIKGASKTWLPKCWRGDIYNLGDSETKLALQYLLNGTPTLIRSNFGNVPSKLRLCNYCCNAVFSEDSDLKQHVNETHQDILSETFIERLLFKFNIKFKRK